MLELRIGDNMYNNDAKKRKRKTIELAILIIIVLWLSLFIIDYIRYRNSKNPLITIKQKTTTFEDGEVTEYFSLGWTYREYKRRAIGDIELTPFFKRMQRPPVANNLPVTKKDYDIPDNPDKLDELKGIVYFYDYGYGELLGTYKCLNTDAGCSKAVSGTDEYNIKDLDVTNNNKENPKFNSQDFKYGWIDDSVSQSTDINNIKQYQRTIYLFDIKNNKILAEYKNIKYSTINHKKEAEGYLNTYIVENKENKWGIIEVSDIGIKTIVDFEYESINFNEKTNTYIVRKDGIWYLYNQDTKEISQGFNDPIIEAVLANGTTLIKTVKQEYFGADKINTYYLYKQDGTKILDEKNVVAMQIEDNFIAYITYDKRLKIIDYEGNQKINDNLIVNYLTFNNNDNELPAFHIIVYINNDFLISIPRINTKDSICDKYYYNGITYKQESVKEGKFE